MLFTFHELFTQWRKLETGTVASSILTLTEIYVADCIEVAYTELELIDCKVRHTVSLRKIMDNDLCEVYEGMRSSVLAPRADATLGNMLHIVS